MRSTPFQKPTPEQVEAAQDKTLPDIIASGLHVLFCGINPGLYSAAVGCHFARPGNRFWGALDRSGFTPRELEPWEQDELLQHGCGLTNLVQRATAIAGELDDEELVRGRDSLVRKVSRCKPRFVAILGIGAYRTAFGDIGGEVGPRANGIGGSHLCVLPNPSGLNAHYHPQDLAREFRELRKAAFR